MRVQGRHNYSSSSSVLKRFSLNSFVTPFVSLRPISFDRRSSCAVARGLGAVVESCNSNVWKCCWQGKLNNIATTYVSTSASPKKWDKADEKAGKARTTVTLKRRLVFFVITRVTSVQLNFPRAQRRWERKQIAKGPFLAWWVRINPGYP